MREFRKRRMGVIDKGILNTVKVDGTVDNKVVETVESRCTRKFEELKVQLQHHDNLKNYERYIVTEELFTLLSNRKLCRRKRTEICKYMLQNEIWSTCQWIPRHYTQWIQLVHGELKDAELCLQILARMFMTPEVVEKSAVRHTL
uniref:Folylpolyglutamate synthase n=1 Tax=Lygus hesperus TaxID=30085 RepID=A0A0A9XLC2_LYGHE